MIKNIDLASIKPNPWAPERPEDPQGIEELAGGMNNLIAKSLDDLGPGFCHWLAGLVDGEGSFQLKHSKKTWWLELTISLRADDRPMLEMIRQELGRGHVFPHPRSKEEAASGHKLRYMLRFHSTADTRFIVRLFQRYPLRSKKKRDFELWAEARGELDKPPLIRDLRCLRYLYRAIREVRKYEAPTIEPYIPEGEQAPLLAGHRGGGWAQ